MVRVHVVRRWEIEAEARIAARRSARLAAITIVVLVGRRRTGVRALSSRVGFQPAGLRRPVEVVRGRPQRVPGARGHVVSSVRAATACVVAVVDLMLLLLLLLLLGNEVHGPCRERVRHVVVMMPSRIHGHHHVSAAEARFCRRTRQDSSALRLSVVCVRGRRRVSRVGGVVFRVFVLQGRLLLERRPRFDSQRSSSSLLGRLFCCPLCSHARAIRPEIRRSLLCLARVGC